MNLIATHVGLIFLLIVACAYVVVELSRLPTEEIPDSEYVP